MQSDLFKKEGAIIIIGIIFLILGLTTLFFRYYKNLSQEDIVFETQEISLSQPNTSITIKQNTNNTDSINVSDIAVEKNDTKIVIKVKINSASQSEIESLPGIGPVYAKRIISKRPFTQIEDLYTADIISEKLFNRIKHLIDL